MNIQQNVSLREYSTMRLGGNARYLVHVADEQEVIEAIQWAHEQGMAYRAIGSGSNIVWRDEGFNGLVIVVSIQGLEFTDNGRVTIGAGVEWDDAVAATVDRGLSGLEFLSFIPGTVGGTPVQNVGAYGQEVKNILTSVTAFDTSLNQMVELNNAECDFDYRTSRFKTRDAGRFIITSVTFQLRSGSPEPPFYESLQVYLTEHDIREYTPKIIRDAVIAIRTNKLPDPFETANNGSFFANPIVNSEKFDELKTQFTDIKGWQMPNGDIKLSAGWLIEQAGFQDYHDEQTGMATWSKQALVLINEHADTTSDLLEFQQKIVSAVQDKFGVTLEQEPELIP